MNYKHINMLFNQMIGLKTEEEHVFDRLCRKLLPKHELEDNFSAIRFKDLIWSQDEYQEQLENALIKEGLDSYMIDRVITAKPRAIYIEL